MYATNNGQNDKKFTQMIQRIQTLFLLAVVVLATLQCLFPVAGFFNETTTQLYDLTFTGVFLQNSSESVMQVWALSILTVIIPTVALITIFLYGKRVLQLRFTVFNIFLMIGYYAVLFVYLWFGKQNLGADWFLNISCSFQLVNVVLSAMAWRAILKDELLVRSLNRIR